MSRASSRVIRDFTDIDYPIDQVYSIYTLRQWIRRLNLPGRQNGPGNWKWCEKNKKPPRPVVCFTTAGVQINPVITAYDVATLKKQRKKAPPDPYDQDHGVKYPKKSILNRMGHQTQKFIDHWCCCFSCLHSEWERSFKPTQLAKLVAQPGFTLSRTEHNSAYLKNMYFEMKDMKIPALTSETHFATVNVLKYAYHMLEHMSKARNYCKRLTYDLKYDDVQWNLEPLTPEQTEMLKERCVIGSYAWLLAFVIPYLEPTQKEILDKHSKIRNIVEDFAFRGIYLWAMIAHVVETTKSILARIDKVFYGFLLRIRPFAQLRYDHLAWVKGERDSRRLSYFYRKKLKKERNLILKKSERAQGEKTISPHIKYKAVIRAGVHGQFMAEWESFANLESKYTAESIHQLLRFAKDTMIDSSSKLKTLFKFYQGQARAEPETKSRSRRKRRRRLVPRHPKTGRVIKLDPEDDDREVSSVLDGHIKLRRALFDQRHFPNNMFREEDIQRLYEVGRVIFDEVDKSFLVIDELLSIGEQARDIVHLSYDYIREEYNFPIPSYQELADRWHTKFLNDWRPTETFQNTLPLYLYHNTKPAYSTSIYGKILLFKPIGILRAFMGIIPRTKEELKEVLRCWRLNYQEARRLRKRGNPTNIPMPLQMLCLPTLRTESKLGEE